MPLNYALHENHLTADPSDYMAVVQNPESNTQNDIIELMINRGSTVTKAEALATIEEYISAIEQLVKDGHNINTPLFNLSLSIKGVFTNEEENFNSAIHSVRINLTPGIRLKEMAANVSVSRVQAAQPLPSPMYLDDLGSGTRNDTLTPGSIAQLKGSRLKFDASDAAQGIFLIAADKSEIKVSPVSHNKPAQIDFLVPSLPAGTYILEIRTILNKTKDLRKGRLPFDLFVV